MEFAEQTELLTEFIRSGEISRVPLECSFDEAIKRLGTPDESCERKQIIKYNDIELHFSAGRLSLIHFCFETIESETDWRRRVGDTIPRIDMVFSEYLFANEIEFSPYPALTFDNQSAVKLANNVVVVFSEHRIASLSRMFGLKSPQNAGSR